MPAGCDPKTDRDHRSRLQLQQIRVIRVILSLPAVAPPLRRGAREGYPWLITQKKKRRENLLPRHCFLYASNCLWCYFTATANWMLPYLRVITHVWV